MASDGTPNLAPEAVDAALSAWRQGDCVLGDQWFVHRVAPSLPLTAAGRSAVAAGTDLADTGVRGLVIVTQSCDVVRKCVDRPYVEVSPLVELPESDFHDVEKRRRPNYAVVPGVAKDRLAADMDRTMTLEKSVVAGWDRVQGCTTDAESRAFAMALARKRQRFAFPDDFVLLVRKLQKRLVDKHDKETPEGRALRALREIRVQASPSWDAPRVELFFWFIREEDAPDFEGTPWDVYKEAWMRLVVSDERYVNIEAQVAELGDLTARDYVDSDRLDLDYLSPVE